jgi:hypothetical protein
MEEKMTTTTRFICIDSRDEYSIRWFTKIIDTNPVFNKNGKLSFAIIGSKGRMEINTLDMNYLEKCAKLLTSPKGRSSISTDKAYIYIKEVGGYEKLLGVLTHKRVKSFAPMHDKVGYR